MRDKKRVRKEGIVVGERGWELEGERWWTRGEDREDGN